MIVDKNVKWCHNSVVARITLRIPDDVYRELVKVSEENDRSVNSEIVRAIKEHIYGRGEKEMYKMSSDKAGK